MAERSYGGLAAALAGAVLLGLLVLAVLRVQAPPEGPVEPAWDRVACTRCRMLVGDPAFAAQAHLDDGEVLHFDDPGCLLLYLHEAGVEPRATWFHHVRSDAWLAGDEVAFVPAAPTPMGYGLAAVEAGASGGLDPESALARVIERDRARRRGEP